MSSIKVNGSVVEYDSSLNYLDIDNAGKAVALDFAQLEKEANTGVLDVFTEVLDTRIMAIFTSLCIGEFVSMYQHVNEKEKIDHSQRSCLENTADLYKRILTSVGYCSRKSQVHEEVYHRKQVN